MQVILLEKIAHVGDLGDVVKVKDGYGRNFLIPTGRAKRATKAAIAEFEARRAELEAAQAERIAAAQKIADTINEGEIEISSKCGVDGRLFGSGVQLFAQSGVLEPQVASLATWHCYRMALLLAPAVLAQRRVHAHVVLPQGVDIAPAGIADDSHGYSLPSGFTAPARNHARRLSAHSGHKALALPSIRALFLSSILA